MSAIKEYINLVIKMGNGCLIIKIAKSKVRGNIVMINMSQRTIIHTGLVLIKMGAY